MFYFFYSYLKTEGQIKYILDQKCICVFICILVFACLCMCVQCPRRPEEGSRALELES